MEQERQWIEDVLSGNKQAYAHIPCSRMQKAKGKQGRNLMPEQLNANGERESRP
ncbi:hypothetical protein [Niallia oryzisoli]|uniref:hypothetical protein n=1 Tax=Niallia oryzisoli TaxID=1737571 RepID=UPI0037350A1B